MTLHTGRDTGVCSLMPYPGYVSVMNVSAQTLDSSFSGVPIRLLKIDVEGAEEHVLIGASKLLDARKIDFIVCEINELALERFGSTQMSVRDFMTGKGYCTFILAEDGSYPELCASYTQLAIPAENTNILFSTEALVKEAWDGP